MSQVLNRRAAGAKFDSPFLLDTYPGAVVAYSSSRKLRSAYSGPAYRVRRASDNAEQDIGFLSSGRIDTTALAAFCSGTTGRVVLWYDQSGSGVNAQQPTLSKAPIVYQSGAATLINSTPALLFTGSEGMNMVSAVPWPSAQGKLTAVLAYRVSGGPLGILIEAGYPSQHYTVSGGLLIDVNDAGSVAIGGTGLSSGSGVTCYAYAPTATPPYNRVAKMAWEPGGTTIATEWPCFQINNATVTPTNFNPISNTQALTQFSLTPMAIGARGDAASLRLVGSLGEIILYPGTTHIAASGLDLSVMSQYGVA